MAGLRTGPCRSEKSSGANSGRSSLATVAGRALGLDTERRDPDRLRPARPDKTDSLKAWQLSVVWPVRTSLYAFFSDDGRSLDFRDKSSMRSDPEPTDIWPMCEKCAIACTCRRWREGNGGITRNERSGASPNLKSVVLSSGNRPSTSSSSKSLFSPRCVIQEMMLLSASGARVGNGLRRQRRVVAASTR